jgi:hypothetical protein
MPESQIPITMQPIRKINNVEKEILDYLIKLARLHFPGKSNQDTLVQNMNDGGMGSFLIFQDSSDIGAKRKFGKQVAEFEFVDDDGVKVLVALNVDDQNNLFEVDIWKTDFNPVINLKVPV